MFLYKLNHFNMKIEGVKVDSKNRPLLPLFKIK